MAKPTYGSKGGGGSKDSDDGGGKGGGGSSSGSSAADDYAKAQKKAEKEQKRNYKNQAETLQGQIDAWKKSINTSYLQALKVRIANFRLLQGQQDAILSEGYYKRVADLRAAASDNEMATGDQSFANIGNRARERRAATEQVALHGGGETDVMRSQVMALRNFVSNQGDITRSYFDTARSIQSSFTDLTNDTKTAKANNINEYNSQREAAYTNYYNQRSESLIQLGNVLGQQAELYGLAGEKGDQEDSSDDSGKYFDQAAREAAKAWKNPGIPKQLMDWKGATPIRAQSTADEMVNAPTVIGKKRAEGANLRTWT
jgi:hypothetical protein